MPKPYNREKNKSKVLSKNNIKDVLRLTPTQEGILFYFLKNPESDLYFEQLILKIRGEIQVGFFKRAWNTVIETNEMLRAVFRWENLKRPIQIILYQKEFRPRFYDFSCQKNAQEAVNKVKEDDRQEKFDLREETFRVTLCHISRKEHEMIITHHHILHDGWSTGILVGEFFNAYNNITRRKPLKVPSKLEFKLFIHWLGHQDTGKQKHFWQQYLAGFEPPRGILSGNSKSADLRESECYRLPLPRDSTAMLTPFIKEKKITLAVLLYSVYGILVQRYSNTDDVVIGTTVSGRTPELEGIESAVGMFINTLPLRIQSYSAETIENLLQRMNRMLQVRRPYEFTCTADIKEYAGYTQEGELFNTIIVIENYPLEYCLRQVKGNLTVDSYSMMEIPHYDLTVEVDLVEDVEFVFRFDRRVIELEAVSVLANHLQNILGDFLENPGKSVEAIEILSPVEKIKILSQFNDTGSNYSREQSINKLFDEQAAYLPDHTALVFEDHLVSYKELKQRSNRLAGLLKAAGVQSDSIVGLMMDRSLMMVISLLGILKAGGAYLPLDPSYPEERVRYILDDSGTEILMTDVIESESGIRSNSKIDIIHGHVIEQSTESPLAMDLQLPEKYRYSIFRYLAYVIYTSGTTGRPKGVMVEHTGVVRLVKNTNFIEFMPADRLLQTGVLEFDASTFEIWGALLNGLSLFLVRKEKILEAGTLKEAIRKNKISIMWLTSSLFNRMSDTDRDIFSGLRYLLVGGEVLSPAHVYGLKEKFTQLKIINGYGPTENTTFSTTYPITRTERTNIPIGRPISNSTAFVLDRYKRLQPSNGEGELWVGGDGLARGYLNNPQLTREKFVHIPIDTGKYVVTKRPPGGGNLSPNRRKQRLYKTGDMVRMMPDGNIEFLGRVDQQVKIRGFRIEPGEIENLLTRIGEVREAVVVAREWMTGDKYLCAYLVPDSTYSLDLTEVRKHLSRSLPDYMIPTYFIPLPVLPLTTNGKVNLKALPEPNCGVEQKRDEPRNEVERKLRQIWWEVLGIGEERIGMEDTFFDLGGHSLKAISLVSRINKVFSINIHIGEIFQNPSIRQLSELLEESSAETSRIIKFTEKKEYYPASSAQRRLFLLHRQHPDLMSYNIPAVMSLNGPFDCDLLEDSLQKLVERHESLRTSFQWIDSELRQIIAAKVDFLFEHFVQHVEEEKLNERLKKTIQEFIRPFNLTQPPLFRAGVISTGKESHTLMVDMHHIIADGASMRILVRELQGLMSGEKLPNPGVQYRDYSTWEHSEAGVAVFTDQEKYWLGEFDKEISLLKMPTDYARLPGKRFKGKTINFSVDHEQIERLKQLASIHKVTLFMIFLAVYYVLLAKLSGQEDIVVGTGSNTRTHDNLRNLVGMLVNTLALRNFPAVSKTFIEFLTEVKERSIRSFANQDYPFGELVKKVKFPVDTGRNPLFDMMYQYDNLNIPIMELPGLTISPFEFDNNTAKFDLTLWVFEKNDAISFAFEYSTGLFSEATIECIIRYFREIVEKAGAEPHRLLEEIAKISEEGKADILSRFDNNIREGIRYVKHRVFQKLLADSLDKFKDRTAIEYHGKTVSYGALAMTSGTLARQIGKRGVIKGSFVGILTNDRLELIEALIAIFRANGAAVPLDATLPSGKLTAMIQAIKLSLIFKDKTGFEDVAHLIDPDKFDKRDFIFFDKRWGAERSKDSTVGEDSYNPGDQLYVYFTSGTTGIPKAVVGKNESLLHFISWEIETLGIDNGTRFSQFTNPGFDAFLRDIFVPLCAGGVICIPESKDVILHAGDLAKWIDWIQINVIHCVPSLFRSIDLRMLPSNSFLSLKFVLLSGESVGTRDIERWYEKFAGRIQLINLYGPTETTMVKTHYFISRSDLNREKVPIGRPMKGAGVLILDRKLNICDRLVTGDLYIGTPYGTYGYYLDPNSNRRKFIPNPFKQNPTCLLFKTGDLGRWSAGWNLEFLGREDRQIKVQGVRIELGEIETCIGSHPVVEEAVVTTRQLSGNSLVCAYIKEKNQNRCDTELSAGETRDFLRARLPEYMVPHHIIFLQEIPRHSNRKVDYSRLPDPVSVSSSSSISPENPTELALVKIWQDLLGIEKISVTQGFFAAGGSSLSIMSLISRIHREFDVRLSLGELFKNQTIKSQANLILEANRDKFHAIKAGEEVEYYALSSQQKRLFVLNEINRNSVSYNMPLTVVLEGNLDKQRIRETIGSLVNFHESLRTSFLIVEKEPVQKIEKTVDFQIEYHSSDLKNEHQSDLHCLVSRFIKPFDLARAPLFRMVIIELAGQEYLIVLDLHHIIADGVSVGIILNDFAAVYSGKELNELRCRYRDYSEWQSRCKRHELFNRQKAYWSTLFEDDIPVMDLPTDFPKMKVQSFEGRRITFDLDPAESESLKLLALQEETTLFSVLLTILFIFFSKLCGQENLIIGTPVAGRSHADLAGIIGMFVNTLAIRSRPAGEKAFNHFLKEVNVSGVEALENQDFPFEELVDMVNIERDTSRNPLFDVTFSLQNIHLPYIDIPGLKLTPREIEPNISKFDLSLICREEGEKLVCYFEFCSRLFRESTIKRFINYFKTVVNSAIGDPKQKISEVNILPKSENVKILYEFNATACDYPDYLSLQEWYCRQASRSPHHVAILGNSNEVAGRGEFLQLSYRQIYETSQMLALHLLENGVKANSVVGILMERSPEMIIGLLGILTAGAAYLPFDPEYPEERILYMLADSGTGAVITDRRDTARSLCKDQMIFGIDCGKKTKLRKARNIEPKTSPLAYVIYTSGSSGRPKGVLVAQLGIVNLVHFYHSVFGEGRKVHSSQVSSPGFDAMALEVWPCLLSGASLHIATNQVRSDPARMKQWLIERGITVTFQSTLMAEYLLAEAWPREGVALRILLTGGDKLNRFPERIYPFTLYNLYGPTEDSVMTTWAKVEIRAGSNGSPCIGKPIANHRVYIMDSNFQLKPIGIPGEICVAGKGVAPGYLNCPELTGERFIKNKNILPLTQTLYRTGDMARYSPDGTLAFLGRIDNQIKIRGYRIELGEIETCLSAHPDIQEAVMKAMTDQNGVQYMVAYYVLFTRVADEKSPMPQILRKYLSQKLPRYMIPRDFVQMERFPLTGSGKIDRRALPKPKREIQGSTYMPVKNGIQKIIIRVFQEVLGIDVIGIEDGFFELGGDSIKAIQVAASLREYGLKLDIADLFTHQTVAALENIIKSEERKIDQGIIEGCEELTPIQQWFFQNHFTDIHHFNQAILLYKVDGFDKERVVAVLTEILTHHDALRMTFDIRGDTVVQRNRGIDGRLFRLHEFSLDDCDDVSKEIYMLGRDIHKRMNLEEGPLVQVGLFHAKVRDYLLVAIHHLVVDGISWRILLEDFINGYLQSEQGVKIKLPPKTDSYLSWVRQQEAYAREEKILQELPYWNSITESDKITWPADYEIDSNKITYAYVEDINWQLDELMTHRLLTDVNSSYGTDMNDILLTALGRAIRDWAGINKLMILIEGHGRDPIAEAIDISRTVGCFTSQFPFLLDLGSVAGDYPDEETQLAEEIKSVKEKLRQIPGKGIGYGILKYLTPANKRQDWSLGDDPSITFNYLGQFTVNNHGQRFGISRLKAGGSVSPRLERYPSLEIKIMIENGQLQCRFTYNKCEFRKSTIKRLLQSFGANLERIIAHCSGKQERVVTPSDLDYSEIETEELENLRNFVREID